MESTIKRRKNTIASAAAQATTSSTSVSPKRQISFPNLLQSFTNECRAKNLSKRTVQFYEENILQMKKIFEAQNLEFNVLALTNREIKHSYIGHMLTNGLASNTVNGRIKTCKAFFKYLFREGFISTNLADELRLVKTEKKMIQTFTKEQVLALLNQPNRQTFTGFRDYTMMMVMLETGMRVGELLNLKITDISFKEMEIRITRGKGAKARRVPIQKTCVKILKQYIEERGNVDTDWLFVNVEGSALRMRTVQENIQQYGKCTGISGVRVSPHTFRHTMAKFYILNGGDVFTLQQILGHSTLDMVRYYLELFSKDIREQHQKYSPVENMTLQRIRM
ncbi:tyrosine-type recombinase/integrase [Paenibacillus cymbidii]|uniref:tyrosine-type recombinase/integrase n=1 Tax=Paenibacillus cymbidii TaxID=1639034 RepID=UPI001080A4A1|nr:tyrosine-type recombinase/integrase [Paenibacillus cymbidii]